MLSDLDAHSEDDQQALQNGSEKCEHYDEEIKVLEEQHGQNVENLQR